MSRVHDAEYWGKLMFILVRPRKRYCRLLTNPQSLVADQESPVHDYAVRWVIRTLPAIDQVDDVGLQDRRVFWVIAVAARPWHHRAYTAPRRIARPIMYRRCCRRRWLDFGFPSASLYAGLKPRHAV